MDILKIHWGIFPEQLQIQFNHETKKINTKKKINRKLPEQIKKQIKT